MAKKKPLSDIKAPLPDARVKPAATPAQSLSRGLVDRFVNDAVNDPVAVLDRTDTIVEIGMKIIPTLPGEFPFPIPRGIYEKIKDTSQVKQLQGGLHAAER